MTRSGSERAGRRTASVWGWIALGATVMSVLGYALQITLDYAPAPPIGGELVFFGLFEGAGIAGLLVGLIAVSTGWNRGDSTLRFGLIGIAWVVLAQTIQSLWD